MIIYNYKRIIYERVLYMNDNLTYALSEEDDNNINNDMFDGSQPQETDDSNSNQESDIIVDKKTKT